MSTLLVFLTNYGQLIAQAISVAEKGLQMAPELATQITEHAQLLEQMVSQNRAPTSDEIDALNADIAKNEAILQAPQA